MHFRAVAVAILLNLGTSRLFAQDAGLDFFEKKIRPVLVEHCYSCHSTAAMKKKGGLLLDTREATRKGGDSGPAVVPGKPGDSWLIKAVHYTDADVRMPPKGKLPAEAIADLERWIANGAADPRDGNAVAVKTNDVTEARKLWAYQPPRKHGIPAVKDRAWPRGVIDAFLLAKLESKGLKPAADADRVTLLRRAYFTLIGLPPTPTEIDAFLANADPQAAYAEVIDRLLASPQFGERWGRHWLDIARYAESSGGGRSLLLKDAWRYRDYVINAFNADTPYDRFLLEQIAGDLLPADTPEERSRQLIATALLLLGPTNYERQDKPTLEMDVIDEQLDTVGKALLGMTIGCARCHDHKFDPIPQRDYYALAGILKSTKFIVHDNVSRWSERPLPMPPALEKSVRERESAIASLQERIKLTKGSPVAKGAVAVASLPGIVIDDTQAKKVGSWKHSKFSGTYVGDGYLYDDRAAKEEKTLTFIPDIPKAGRYEVRLAYVPHENRATNVPVRIFHADGEVTVRVNQRLTPPVDGHFVSLGTFRFEPGGQWFVMVATDGANGHVIADAVQFLPERAAEAKPPAAVPGGLAGLEAELKRLQASGPERPLAMAVADAERVEDCHLAIRGNFHNRGALVPRGFLSVLSPPGSPAAIPAKQSGRRQLAEWLVRADNPLTARVMVNRVWHHVFGAGLVRTVDNFGAAGEAPSHPELLDTLAVRFVANGWSIKKLIREMMLSHAYQQSSAGNPDAVKLDPENRLLGRMNRQRLEAEAIRDAMLAVAGNLDGTMGGPMFKPGTLERAEFKFVDTRRSVYTPVFRNRLHEAFEVFDFADPNIGLGKRNVSTVAPQALYLMNSPFVMDQARRFAQSLPTADSLDDAARIDRAYRMALGRLPSERERQIAQAFVARGGEASWERLCQALFACIDFRYVD